MEASSSLNMPSFQPAFIKVVRWRGRLRRAETTQQVFFQRGVTKHFSLEYTGNEALDDKGDFKWDSNECDVGTHAVPFNQLWFQDLSGGLISKKKIADDGNTSQVDGFSMIYVPQVLYISGGLPDAVPSQNPSGMDTAKWDALHLPPARPHVMRRKKKPSKGMVGFLLNLFQEAKAPSVVWQNHHSPFAESSCVTLCLFQKWCFWKGNPIKISWHVRNAWSLVNYGSSIAFTSIWTSQLWGCLKQDCYPHADWEGQEFQMHTETSVTPWHLTCFSQKDRAKITR